MSWIVLYSVRHGPARRGWLNAFGAAIVLRDLPDALALLVELWPLSSRTADTAPERRDAKTQGR